MEEIIQVGYETGFPDDALEASFIQYFQSIMSDLEDSLGLRQNKTFIDNQAVVPFGGGGWTIKEILYRMANGDLDLSSTYVSIPSLLDMRIYGNVSFLQPTFQDVGNEIIFRQPRLNRIENIYVTPFSYKLWILWVIFILLLHSVRVVVHAKSWKDVVMQFIADLCNQGYRLRHVRRLDTRWICWLGSVTSACIILVYSTSLFSIISDSRIPVKEINDLVRFSYKLVVHELSATGKKEFQYLKTAHHFSQVDPILTDTESEVKIILSRDKKRAFISNWGFFHQIAILQNYTENFICQTFTRFRLLEKKRSTSLVVRKEWKLKTEVNLRLIQLRERGHIAHHFSKGRAIYAARTRGQCGLKVGGEMEPMEQSETSFALVLAFCGLFVSIVILGVELSIIRSSNKNRNRTKIAGKPAWSRIPMFSRFNDDVQDIESSWMEDICFVELENKSRFACYLASHWALIVPYASVPMEECFAQVCQKSHKTIILAPQMDHESKPTLGHDLWGKKETMDIIFSVEGKNISAHKLVLTCRSEYFAKMFSGEWAETKGRVIEIKDTKYDTFEALLFHIYNYKVTFLEEEYENICDLMMLADCYCDVKLRRECEEILMQNIRTENAFFLLRSAASANAMELDKKVTKFIVDNRLVDASLSDADLVDVLGREALYKLGMAALRR